MAKSQALTHELLTTGLAERVIPVDARGIVDLRSSKPAAAIARIGGLGQFGGDDIERFAMREGRGRELLIYLVERAARHVRSWRARGFRGSLYVPLPVQELQDRTLATSFDIIAKSQNIDQRAFTFIVSLRDYLERYAEVSSAIARIYKIGCGVAMGIDSSHLMKFRTIPDHPFTALMLAGKDVWRRLRTAGPGRLGALGSWIGWAESIGLERTAVGISNATEEETARAYGFGFGVGMHYSDFVPARRFLLEEDETAIEPGTSASADALGLPPPPRVALRRA